jgi:pantothenate kinase-related protein Tda10
MIVSFNVKNASCKMALAIEHAELQHAELQFRMQPGPLLICVCGFEGSGKDAVSVILEEQFQFNRCAIHFYG